MVQVASHVQHVRALLCDTCEPRRHRQGFPSWLLGPWCAPQCSHTLCPQSICCIHHDSILVACSVADHPASVQCCSCHNCTHPSPFPLKAALCWTRSIGPRDQKSQSMGNKARSHVRDKQVPLLLRAWQTGKQNLHMQIKSATGLPASTYR